MTKEMTDKLISFDLESTGYTDEDGNFVKPEKAEDLVKVAMARMLPEEEKETFTTIYCYKKRVFDNKLVLIGEIFCSSETIGSWYYAPWNPKIVGQETSTKNEYYPNFYNVEGNPLIVDSHAYEVQLYTEPVKDINNLPYTTGTIDTETSNINGGIYMTYWDNYVDNRVIEICYQSNELYKELEKLRGVC